MVSKGRKNTLTKNDLGNSNLYKNSAGYCVLFQNFNFSTYMFSLWIVEFDLSVVTYFLRNYTKNFTQDTTKDTAKLVEVNSNVLFSHLKTWGYFNLKDEFHRFSLHYLFSFLRLNLRSASRSVNCWESLLLASSVLTCHLMIFRVTADFCYQNGQLFSKISHK